MNNKTPHILHASANLLGFSFVVLTSIRVLGVHSQTLIDETLGVSILIFLSSSLLSFLSIRSSGRKSQKYEDIADVVFLLGLVSLFLIAGLTLFNII